MLLWEEFKMNRKMMTIAASLIAIIMLIGGTYAYFTTEGRVRNSVSASNVKIAINVRDAAGNDMKNKTLIVVPGMSAGRIVTVSNVGREPGWVRVRAVLIDEGTRKEIGAGGIIQDEGSEVSAALVNTDDWTFKDGYFYYNKILAPSETTSALMERLDFAFSMDNEYAGSEIGFDIHAYATQSKHNGEKVMEAKGWPAE